MAGYSGSVSCLDGVEVIGYVGEDHKPGVSLYGLTCFIYGQQAISLNKMEQSARRDAVCHCLAKFFDSQDALEVIWEFLKYKNEDIPSLSSGSSLLLFSLFGDNHKMCHDIKYCVIINL